DTRGGQVLTKERHRIADPGAEIEHGRCRRRGALRRRKLALEIDDLVLGEILGALARDANVRRVQRAVLGGELVELGLVHVSTLKALDTKRAAFRALRATLGSAGS